jgi:hypothetical protein
MEATYKLGENDKIGDVIGSLDHSTDLPSKAKDLSCSHCNIDVQLLKKIPSNITMFGVDKPSMNHKDSESLEPKNAQLDLLHSLNNRIVDRDSVFGPYKGFFIDAIRRVYVPIDNHGIFGKLEDKKRELINALVYEREYQDVAKVGSTKTLGLCFSLLLEHHARANCLPKNDGLDHLRDQDNLTAPITKKDKVKFDKDHYLILEMMYKQGHEHFFNKKFKPGEIITMVNDKKTRDMFRTMH